ncbi:hypothetical protein PGB90_000923 [Kerria lacca]
MNLPLYTLSESESEFGEVTDRDNIITTSNINLLHNDRKRKNKISGKKRKEKCEIAAIKSKIKDNDKEKDTKFLKPGECMQYISVRIDPHLLSANFGVELLLALKTADIQYDINSQKIPHTIFWSRKISQNSENNSKDSFVIIWSIKELISLISSKKLKSQIIEYITRTNNGFTLIIFGTDEYFRTRKKKNREGKVNFTNRVQLNTQNSKQENVYDLLNFNRFDIETALGEVQLLLNIQYKFIETEQELGLFIVQFTKSLAELPYKQEKSRRQQCVGWFATADSKECVHVDHNNNGLLKLWQQQLCQFPNIGLDIAQAIISNYNSPRTLMEAYEKCSTQKEGELLLQNIPVRRIQGPLTSVRRIGPEISKKVYLFFNNKNAEFSFT